MPSDRTKEFNLKHNIAALLCYVAGLNLLVGPLWLKTESKSNTFLRFHALQGLVMTGAYLVLAIAMYILELIGHIPFLGFIGMLAHTLGWFAGVIYLGANIFMMIAAMNENQFSLPFVGEVAEQLLSKEEVSGDEPPLEG